MIGEKANDSKNGYVLRRVLVCNEFKIHPSVEFELRLLACKISTLLYTNLRHKVVYSANEAYGGSGL